jgi:UDP-2,4-diacetamido-2,4,6-trideoxy-beta-L-altropyranose hydrolase
LALAQVWQAEGESAYFVGEITEGLESRLRNEGITTRPLESTPGKEEDALETVRTAQEIGASWVVVDGYHFDGSYQRRLREKGARVLALDDHGHADRYEANLVLNQNIDAEPVLYRNKAKDTELLLGPRFALLRKEFWPWRKPRRAPRDETRRVLVTLGGVDPDNCTKTVIEAIGQLPRADFECTVVVGGSNPNEASVVAAAERTSVSMDLRSDVEDMASLMAEHDIAVSAGGSTCWELAFMGIPSVILVLADNQRGIAEGLDEAGTALNLGWHEAVEKEEIAAQIETLLRNDEQRVRMTREAQALVDGWGTDRVVSHMRNQLFLRPVCKADRERLWHWANDPDVRKRSYNQSAIPWEDHKEWFSKKLSDPSCKIFIAEDAGAPLGQARFDLKNGKAVISVVVDSEKRGQGYGTALIKQGTERCLQATEADRVDAYIKKGNDASIRAFEKAGFHFCAETTVKGEPSFRFSTSREPTNGE